MNLRPNLKQQSDTGVSILVFISRHDYKYKLTCFYNTFV